MYQALDTQDEFIVGSAWHMRFVDSKKNTENWRSSYPVTTCSDRMQKRQSLFKHKARFSQILLVLF